MRLNGIRPPRNLITSNLIYFWLNGHRIVSRSSNHVTLRFRSSQFERHQYNAGAQVFDRRSERICTVLFRLLTLLSDFFIIISFIIRSVRVVFFPFSTTIHFVSVQYSPIVEFDVLAHGGLRFPIYRLCARLNDDGDYSKCCSRLIMDQNDDDYLRSQWQHNI